MVVVRGGMVVDVYKHQLGNILTSPGRQVSIPRLHLGPYTMGLIV